MKQAIILIFALTVASLFSGCSHTRNIGLEESSPAFDAEQIRSSCSDKVSVRKLLGAPSFTNETQDRWYYVSIKVQEAPFSSVTKSQKVTEIEFSEEKLSEIKTSSQLPSKVRILSAKTPAKFKQSSSRSIISTSTKKAPKTKRILNFY